jgi:hypothetical protein
MEMFGQDLFAVNKYPTGTIYTFRFNNNYKVEVTESKKDYYTMSVFDSEKKICHDLISWLDESSLVDKLSKIKALGVV